MFTNKNGEVTTNEKEAWTEKRGKKFFVKGFNNTVVNPHMFINTNQMQWYQVNERCYNNFVRFLKTGAHSALANANRDFIERIL